MATGISRFPSALDPVTQAALDHQATDKGYGTLWPGAIGDTEHATPIGDHSAAQQGLPGHPSPGTPPDHNDFLGGTGLDADSVPVTALQDQVHWQEHAVPFAVWNASAGNINGPGLRGPLHAIGTGSDPDAFEIDPDIGHPVNSDIEMPAAAPSWAWDPATGERVQVNAGRIAHDQHTNVNGSGYNLTPRFTRTELPPIYQNLAEPGQPTLAPETPYAVGGNLSAWTPQADNNSVLYTPPQDPAVNQIPLANAPAFTDSGSGMW